MSRFIFLINLTFEYFYKATKPRKFEINSPGRIHFRFFVIFKLFMESSSSSFCSLRQKLGENLKIDWASGKSTVQFGRSFIKAKFWRFEPSTFWTVHDLKRCILDKEVRHEQQQQMAWMNTKLRFFVIMFHTRMWSTDSEVQINVNWLPLVVGYY